MSNKSNAWTDERRARQSMLIRGWQPWLRSTGPKSAAGKAISSRNARTNPVRRELAEIISAVRQARRAANKPSPKATAGRATLNRLWATVGPHLPCARPYIFFLKMRVSTGIRGQAYNCNLLAP